MAKLGRLFEALGGQKITKRGSALTENELFCLRELILEGMRGCKDPELLAAGKEAIAIMDAEAPYLQERQRINILAQGTTPKQMGGTLAIGHGSKPSGINPLLTTDTISANLMEIIFSNLVKFNAAGEAMPDLAYNWEISSDGLLHTFFIRNDVKFHDGHPLTAHDVEFTYRSMAESGIPLLVHSTERIEGMETKGDYIFRTKLKHPYRTPLRHLCRAIAPKHLLEGADLQTSQFNRHPIGTGPFRVTEWSDDETMALERNKFYFQKARPILDKLVLRWYEDRNSAIEAIQIGEVDIALDLTYRDIMFLSAGREFQGYSIYNGSYYVLLFNHSKALFQAPEIRKAFDHIVDRDRMVSRTLHEYSKPVTGPFLMGSFACDPDVEPREHSIDKAHALLADYGWKFKDGRLCRDGQRLHISIAIQDNSRLIEKIAAALKDQLLESGVKVDFVYTDGDRNIRNSCDLIISQLQAPEDPDACYGYWHSGRHNGDTTRYSSPEVDRLFQLGRQTTGPAEQKAVYRQIHQLIHKKCAAVFLCSASNFLTSRYVLPAGHSFSSINHFLSSIKDWEMEVHTAVQKDGAIATAEG